MAVSPQNIRQVGKRPLTDFQLDYRSLEPTVRHLTRPDQMEYNLQHVVVRAASLVLLVPIGDVRCSSKGSNVSPIRDSPLARCAPGLKLSRLTLRRRELVLYVLLSVEREGMLKLSRQEL